MCTLVTLPRMTINFLNCLSFHVLQICDAVIRNRVLQPMSKFVRSTPWRTIPWILLSVESCNAGEQVRGWYLTLQIAFGPMSVRIRKVNPTHVHGHDYDVAFGDRSRRIDTSLTTSLHEWTYYVRVGCRCRCLTMANLQLTESSNLTGRDDKCIAILAATRQLAVDEICTIRTELTTNFRYDAVATCRRTNGVRFDTHQQPIARCWHCERIWRMGACRRCGSNHGGSSSI